MVVDLQGDLRNGPRGLPDEDFLFGSIYHLSLGNYCGEEGRGRLQRGAGRDNFLAHFLVASVGKAGVVLTRGRRP